MTGYDTDLEVADTVLRRIKDRLFDSRDPQEFRQALEDFHKKHGRYPDLKSYWDVLIGGVQQSINKRRPMV